VAACLPLVPLLQPPPSPAPPKPPDVYTPQSHPVLTCPAPMYVSPQPLSLVLSHRLSLTPHAPRAPFWLPGPAATNQPPHPVGPKFTFYLQLATFLPDMGSGANIQQRVLAIALLRSASHWLSTSSQPALQMPSKGHSM
jgi:hypothetical protein